MAEVLLVGCGRMGAALLAGWRARGGVRAVAVEPDGAAAAAARRCGATVVATAGELPAGLAPETVVFAVKPQALATAAAEHAAHMRAGALALSIAAGRGMAWLEERLGPGAAIVRAMPNTPAAVGEGIAALVANRHASPAQRRRAEALLQAVGETVWLEDEAAMDAVTAVSGSGPAYVFLLMEALAAAGRAAGLAPGLACRLARQTVIGAGALARATDEAPASLRAGVTSPGGTTERALAVLTGGDGSGALFDLFERAVIAATRRTHELGR